MNSALPGSSRWAEGIPLWPRSILNASLWGDWWTDAGHGESSCYVIMLAEWSDHVALMERFTSFCLCANVWLMERPDTHHCWRRPILVDFHLKMSSFTTQMYIFFLSNKHHTLNSIEQKVVNHTFFLLINLVFSSYFPEFVSQLSSWGTNLSLNTLFPPHWTISIFFLIIRSIRMHLVPL